MVEELRVDAKSTSLPASGSALAPPLTPFGAPCQAAPLRPAKKFQVKAAWIQFESIVDCTENMHEQQ